MNMKAIWSSVSIVIVLVGLLGMAGRPPLVGGPAPEIVLKDLRGQEVRLSDFRGKVVLLNFWATWCKPCKEEMPAMQASYDKLRDKGLAVVAVNELEDTDKVAQHIRNHGHTFEVIMDKNNKVANRYGVVGLPASFIIDPQGIVRERIVGSLLTESRIEELFRQYASTLASDAR
jgi:DsbE subfamily thiol:disulfide oxidoreductase